MFIQLVLLLLLLPTTTTTTQGAISFDLINDEFIVLSFIVVCVLRY
jgi:hypothetical protein